MGGEVGGLVKLAHQFSQRHLLEEECDAIVDAGADVEPRALGAWEGHDSDSLRRDWLTAGTSIPHGRLGLTMGSASLDDQADVLIAGLRAAAERAAASVTILEAVLGLASGERERRGEVSTPRVRAMGRDVVGEVTVWRLPGPHGP